MEGENARFCYKIYQMEIENARLQKRLSHMNLRKKTVITAIYRFQNKALHRVKSNEQKVYESNQSNRQEDRLDIAVSAWIFQIKRIR